MEISRNKMIVKLRGFTLIEVIIGLVLSGILLSLAFKAILTIVSFGSNQTESTAKNNELLILHTILEENFLKSEEIVLETDNCIIFNFQNRHSLNLSFLNSNIIIRKGEAYDTLRIKCHNLTISKLVGDTTIVEKVSFTVKVHNLDFPFSIVKEYPKQVLFKTDK